MRRARAWLWVFALLAAVARLRMPLLLIVAERDEPFHEQAGALYRAAGSRERRLLVVHGSGHGTGLVKYGDQAARVLAAVRAFADAHG